MAELLMTLDQLIEKCGEDDPLYSEPEQLERIGENVLIIRGHDNDKGYADDLRITIHENALSLHYKEPGTTDSEDEWQLVDKTCNGCTGPFDCINTMAYSL